MAEIYELVPTTPHKKLKREVEELKEIARNKVLVQELLRSNLKSQENLVGLMSSLKKSLEDFNSLIAEEKKIGVKQIRDKLQEVIKQNSELIGYVNDLTKSLKEKLEEKEKKLEIKPEFRPMTPPPLPTAPLPLPTLPVGKRSIPISYKRTKEVSNE